MVYKFKNNPKPQHGDTKQVVKFLLFPRWDNEKIVWWEWAVLEYVFVEWYTTDAYDESWRLKRIIV